VNRWILAVRPKIYVAGIAPVILGTALAVADGVVHWLSFPLLVICSALIQTTSNLINDLEDAKRGADAYRIGPKRLVSSGIISATEMRNVSIVVAFAAFVLGLPLVYRAGWEVLAIGVVCLIMAWAYTGGPFPLAYHGLGDVAAFVFFGLFAVAGTYYVHACFWSSDAIVLAIGPGLLAANILGVNNIRDIPTDTMAGKRTLAVRIGPVPARIMYAVFTVASVVAPSFILGMHRGWFVWLPLLVLPFGVILSVKVLRNSGAELNIVLIGTAIFYVIYTLLMSAGLVLSS